MDGMVSFRPWWYNPQESVLSLDFPILYISDPMAQETYSFTDNPILRKQVDVKQDQ